MSRKHRVEMATPRNSSIEHFITVPISRKIKGVNINLSRSRAPERSCDFRNRVRATKHGAWVRAALTYRCDSWREMHTPDVCTPAYDALIPRENSIWKGILQLPVCNAYEQWGCNAKKGMPTAIGALLRTNA